MQKNQEGKETMDARRALELTVDTVQIWANERIALCQYEAPGAEAVIRCRICKAKLWPDEEQHDEWCLVREVEGLAYAALEAQPPPEEGAL